MVIQKIDRWLASRWFLALCLAQFVLALGLFTYYALSPEGMAGRYPDEVLHFVGNLLLFLSARLAFLRLGNIWFVVMFALFYGTCMEFAQHLMPRRYFDAGDLIANWLGVGGGLLLSLFLHGIFRFLKKRKK